MYLDLGRTDVGSDRNAARVGMHPGDWHAKAVRAPVLGSDGAAAGHNCEIWHVISGNGAAMLSPNSL